MACFLLYKQNLKLLVKIERVMRVFSYPCSKRAYTKFIGIGPEIIQFLLWQILLFGSFSWPVQTNVVEIHLAGTTGCCYVAFSTKTDSN